VRKILLIEGAKAKGKGEIRDGKGGCEKNKEERGGREAYDKI